MHRRRWLSVAGGGGLYRIITGPVTAPVTTTGSEFLPDPGLEANYTAGRCDTLTASGSPTLAQSADVHGGSKAQQFTGTANLDRAYWNSMSVPAGTWVAFSIWCKRTAGTAGQVYNALLNGSGQLGPATGLKNVTSATYAQNVITGYMKTTGDLACYLARQIGTSYDTIIGDDGSLKAITGLFTLYSHGATYGTFSAKITRGEGAQAGLVLNANDRSNPTTYDHIYLNSEYGSTGKIYRDKVISGTRTNLGSWSAAYAAGATLSVTRHQDGTVDIAYNGVSITTGEAASGATGTNWGFFGTTSGCSATDLTADSRSVP
jgi:hypothetical protein